MGFEEGQCANFCIIRLVIEIQKQLKPPLTSAGNEENLNNVPLLFPLPLCDLKDSGFAESNSTNSSCLFAMVGKSMRAIVYIR